VANPGRSQLASVSVVIPALNVAATLTDQLDALAEQSYPGWYEVLISDNGSSDQTPRIVTAYAALDPRFKRVDASSARGINHARNAGAAVAQGDYILFCDGDDIVAKEWIEEMQAVLAEFDAVGGAVEHRLLNGDRERGVHLQSRLTEPKFLPSPLGANCGVRATVLREVGGFDESLVGGAADDVEFFWRLQLRGYTLGMAPDAVVHYRLPVNSKQKARKAYRAGRESARLHKRYRVEGHPRRPLTGGIRSVLSLILRAPLALVSMPQREKWLPMAAKQWGRLVGSVKYRTLYP